MGSGGQPDTEEWTPEEDKTFETELAKHFKDPDRWEKIAAVLGSKDAQACKRRFEALQKDISDIEGS